MGMRHTFPNGYISRFSRKNRLLTEEQGDKRDQDLLSEEDFCEYSSLTM